MQEIKDLLQIDIEKTIEKIVSCIRTHIIELRKDGAVIGFSGGIDSALVLTLTKMAIGEKNTLALLLPERDSDRKTLSDAKRFTRSLGVKSVKKSISLLILLLGAYRLFPPSRVFPDNMVRKYVKSKNEEIEDRLGMDVYQAKVKGIKDPELLKADAYHGIKNRLRMSAIYYHAELNNYLVVGCINKSEWLTGFFVKHGDGTADIMPLESLFKTQVIELARHLSLPEYIIDKSPSSDLVPHMTDESLLGMPYNRIDKVLAGLEHGYNPEKLLEYAEIERHELERIMVILNNTEDQRKAKIGSCS